MNSFRCSYAFLGWNHGDGYDLAIAHQAIAKGGVINVLHGYTASLALVTAVE